MRRSLPLLLLSLAACGTDTVDDYGNIDLSWQQADVFHVGARYRIASVKTENTAMSLEGDAADFGDTWSDEAVWTYQVVQTGVVPESNDELYEYAEEDGEVHSLSVLRAYIDASLNDDEALLESDPVIYMVFREDRDRLAAVISFINRDGVREEQAWGSNELDRAYGSLSQSMLTGAPTYLAPFTTRFEDAEIRLEDGSLLTTEVAADGVVDAYFDDELGDSLVMTRYEVGQPWPTVTLSDNVEAYLLSADDVSARRASLPFLLDDPPEDFDYRAALRSAVKLDAALYLDEDTMAGGWDSAAYEGYRPWAGSWWALSKAELVFGYETWRDTYSRRILDQVRPLKEDMDRLSEELRELDEGADGRDAKVTEYQDKQEELVTILRDFYDDLRQDLDGGIITVADGQMTHTEDGWSYAIDELSTFDKFALHRHLAGDNYPNPFYGPASEILNGYNPVGGSWWGHCNGWAAAAILNFEPREPLSVSAGGIDIEYTTADLKGLLTETHYSTSSQFYGSRYYKEGDDIADLTPKAFHQIIQFYLRDQRVPLVFDTTADAPVWNYPAWGAAVSVSETTDAAEAGKLNVNTATKAELIELPGIGEVTAEAIIEYRMYKRPFQSVEELTSVDGIGDAKLEDLRDLVRVDAFERTFHVTADVRFTTDGVDEDFVDVDENNPHGFTNSYGYELVTDAKGRVVSGTWDNEREHPDFAWVPYFNAKTESGRSSENTYVPYGSFLSLVSDEFERH